MIKPNMRAGNQDEIYPRSDTCFFNFELPQYSSKEVLKQKLVTAIYLDADSMDADVAEDEDGHGGGGGLAMFGGRGAARALGLSRGMRGDALHMFGQPESGGLPFSFSGLGSNNDEL